MFQTLIGPAGFFKKYRYSIKGAVAVQKICCNHLFIKNLPFGKRAFSCPSKYAMDIYKNVPQQNLGLPAVRPSRQIHADSSNMVRLSKMSDLSFGYGSMTESDAGEFRFLLDEPFIVTAIDQYILTCNMPRLHAGQEGRRRTKIRRVSYGSTGISRHHLLDNVLY